MNDRNEQNEPQTDNLLTGELLTMNEAARYLKISRKTLYAWKRQNKIRFLKIAGTLVRIPRAELAALVAYHRENPEPGTDETTKEANQ